ncbi:MAG: NUDIX hydrolase [Anaeroplasma sp.]|nr:NUDIX hydrolase [Anaeroplasma sp.]
MEMREKKIDGETIFEGKVVKVIKDKVLCPNGNESYREIVKHNGGAAILCVTPDKKILLEKQFRYAYDEIIYEIPAGKLECGEDPYQAALREFEEETGNHADSLEFLGSIYPTCGYSSEIIYIYLAKDYKKTTQKFDDDEVIELHYFSIEEVEEMILSGIIKDAKTICALNYYLLKYGKLSKK